MQFICDFHIHSKYSRATSKETDVDNLAKWAKIKGVNVLGTGDFTHPLWLKELKEKLEPAESGLFKYKDRKIKNHNGFLPNNHQPEVRFILTTEISSIYSKGNKTRKIHNLVFAPSFEVVEKINTHLGWIGNLKSDGRPILGLDSKELAKIVLGISEDCLIIPAHAWTPWFSIFGSFSGFDSIEECFEEYTKYIYAIETGLSCYDEKTEILTDNGWKKISEANYSDKICTLNASNNQIEFQKPKKVFKYKYRGKMYRLKTKRVDLLITPNHKLLISGCDFRKPPRFFLKEAEFLFGKSKRFKKDGIWTAKNIEYFTLPSVDIKHGSRYYSGFRNKKEKRFPIKQWLKFFGFWIAEGWTNNGKDGDYNVCLANNNKNLLLEMKQILESFSYNVYQDKKTSNVIRVRDYQLFNYLRQFGKSADKFIPKEIKSLPKELIEILFKYYIKGDGHIYGRTGRGLSATTISVRLRDDLQEIALKLGMSAYYKLHNKKGTPFRGGLYKNRIYKQNEDSWVIYFIRKNIHTVLPSLIKKWGYIEKWINFDDFVYCVSVPNKVIYIRRNGIPVWCGNSDPAMNWQWSALDNLTLISNSDAHSPSKIGREANIFAGEKIDYNSIKGAIMRQSDGLKLIKTIEFFPEEGKYHWDGHRNCGVVFSPEESFKYNNVCPRCGKPLTIGVMNRVRQLADRKPGEKPANAVPFQRLIPLEEIIADVLGMGVGTKGVAEYYKTLIRTFGNEFKILLEVKKEEIAVASSPEIAEGIERVRQEKISVSPGYDGEFGKINVFKDNEERPKTIGGQETLF